MLLAVVLIAVVIAVVVLVSVERFVALAEDYSLYTVLCPDNYH